MTTQLTLSEKNTNNMRDITIDTKIISNITMTTQLTLSEKKNTVNSEINAMFLLMRKMRLIGNRNN